MNPVDVLLVVIILFGIYMGYQRGFLLGALDLLFLIVGLFAAFKTYPYVAGLIESHSASIGVWTVPLAFICCYLLARLLLSIIVGGAFRRVSEETHKDTFNKTLGIIPGAINGLLNAAIISALLFAAPIFDGLSERMRESRIANLLTPPIEWAEDKFAPVFDKAIRHTINSLTISQEANKFVKLPYSLATRNTRPDLEATMLVLVNQERRKEGLDALAPDVEMRAVARAHSTDMFARGYFAHTSPEGKTLSDRARAANVRYITAGENLALAPSLSMAHNGLMNSPGHRTNILHKGYNRVGIGILDGGRYGLMVTQNFRN